MIEQQQKMFFYHLSSLISIEQWRFDIAKERKMHNAKKRNFLFARPCKKELL